MTNFTQKQNNWFLSFLLVRFVCSEKQKLSDLLTIFDKNTFNFFKESQKKKTRFSLVTAIRWKSFEKKDGLNLMTNFEQKQNNRFSGFLSIVFTISKNLKLSKILTFFEKNRLNFLAFIIKKKPIFSVNPLKVWKSFGKINQLNLAEISEQKQNNVFFSFWLKRFNVLLIKPRFHNLHHEHF